MKNTDDERDRLFHSLLKSQAREEHLLKGRIDSLDKRCRDCLLNINNAILAEKKNMDRIKHLPEHYTRKHYDSVTHLPGMRRQHSSDFSSTESLFRKFPASDGDEPDISISGQKIGRPVQAEPKMSFWCQDVSTRLPVQTSFYGFRIGLQRSMTEVKLLGESMYPENTREIQSADPSCSRHMSQGPNLARAGQSKSGDAINYGGGGYQDENKQGVPPPPSRESHVQMQPNIFQQKIRKVPGHVAEIRPSDPSEIKLNLKQSESSEAPPSSRQLRRKQLNVVLSGSSKCPDGRLLRQNVKLLSFKTREEATKHYRKILEDKNAAAAKAEVPKVHVVSELERSYTYIPTVKEEVTRPQTDVKQERAQTGGQYSKSTYGLNMQNSISRKVLNKNNLPMPFRKNRNTFLKHYGYPVLDDKTRHYNTPETFVTCTPVSLLN